MLGAKRQGPIGFAASEGFEPRSRAVEQNLELVSLFGTNGPAGTDHAGLLERALLGAEQTPRTGITSLSAGFHQVCVKTALSGVECGGASLSQFRFGADDHVARGVRF